MEAQARLSKLKVKIPTASNQAIMIDETLPAIHGQPPSNLAHLYSHEAAPLDALKTAHYWRAQAVEWKTKALNGDAVAAQNVGVLLLRAEQGVPKDEVEAVKFFRMAAEAGLSESMFHVGWSYASGLGTPQDWTQAVRWWKAAAEAGHASAARNLGLLYYSGIAPCPETGVCKVDYEAAARYYHLSAKLGNYKACFALAEAYQYGRGVSRSAEHMEYWQRRGEELMRRSGRSAAGAPGYS